MSSVPHSPRASGRTRNTNTFTSATARICQCVSQKVQKWMPPGPEVTAGVR
jgi:hypothetical protein